MEKVIFYDKKNDILSVHKGFASDEKFKGNVDVGDIVLDLSNKARVRGIEIMHASSFFREFGISKKMLESIENLDFRANVKPNGIFIGLSIIGKEIEQKIPIAVPL